MNKKILLLPLLIIASKVSLAQTATTTTRVVTRTHVNLDGKIIKDSTGVVMPADEWHKRLATGKYKLSGNAVSADSLLLVRMSSAEMSRWDAMMPAPFASPAFPTGEKKDLQKLKDINENKIDFKTLAGKVVVLNFWFIACEPCKMEIPELNKLVAENPDVVFAAVGLDFRYEIKDFLKTNTFDYRQTYDGLDYCTNLGVASYPTNVVIDKKGVTRFSATGYGPNTLVFLKRVLNEVKSEN